MIKDTYVEYFSKTYSKYSNQLLDFLFFLIQDKDACMDILQDAFLKLFEKKIFLDPDKETTLAFLRVVMKNAALDYIRKRARELKKINRIVTEEISIDAAFYSNVEDMYIKGEIISTFNDTINSFPENEQQVLLGNFFQGKTLNVVAGDYQMSVHSVKKIVRKFTSLAIKNLKMYFIDDYTPG